MQQPIERGRGNQEGVAPAEPGSGRGQDQETWRAEACKLSSGQTEAARLKDGALAEGKQRRDRETGPRRCLGRGILKKRAGVQGCSRGQSEEQPGGGQPQ